MRLHDYAASANCYKVRLLLALLGRDYERVPVDIFAGDTLTDEYAALNPVRETPGAGARLRRGDRAVARDPLVHRRGHAVPAGRAARAGAGAAVARVRAGAGDGWHRRPALPAPDRPPAGRGALAIGAQALDVLDAHLRERDWLVGERCTIADLAVFGYGHVAPDAGFEPGEHVAAWIERVRALPGFVADLAPYPDNARPGASRSIYD